MPQESQRDIEKKHGKVLMDFLGIKYTLEIGNPPAPDLLFTDEGRKIGVEHTRFIAEALKAREILINKLTDAARCEYEKRQLPPVEVKLYISRCHIKKADIEVLANQIVDVVTRNSPDPGRITEVDNINDECLPAEIDSITMIRLPEPPASFFAPRSAWIVTIDAAYLQLTIDKKAKHLQLYRDACDEVWLLMVEEGSDLSSTLEMPEKLWKHTYDFRGFARAFLLRGTNERLPIRELVCH